MKMIVTGSHGFIGRALVKALQKRGIDVICVDRKASTDKEWLRPTEAERIWYVLDHEEIDCVFHLAAQTSVFNTDIEQIREDNIDTFIRVAMACQQRNVKLVYASSSTANTGNTTSFYGLSKRFDEEFAKLYCPNATAVRLHNVYGPDPRKGTLLWHLMNDETVTLYNNGKNLRHFTYIDDAVEGLIYAYSCDKRIVNVANPSSLAVHQFCNLVQQYVDFNITYTMRKRDRDNLMQSVDEKIFCVPLEYVSVAEGLKRIFGEPKADS